MNNDNPLLNRIRMPGETFRLPSGGIFYTNEELHESVREGEVHVEPMTAIDEIVMKSPDKLFSGQAVKEVFGRCIPEVLKPGQLLAKDVDHLIICLRKVSFGNDLEIVYTHDCKDAEEHSYIVQINELIKASRTIDPTTLSSFNIKLENDQTVVLEPVRFEDYTRILQANQEKEFTPEEWKDVMLDSLRDVIQSVDTITDKEMIREWLEKVPAGWLKSISGGIETTSDWGPTFETSILCRDCGERTPITAPLNPIAFFT